MKIPFRMILNTLLVLLIFIGLQLYIGWNMYVFISYYVSEISIFVLGIFLTVVSLGYAIGRIKRLGPIGRFIKVIGSYYFALLEFFILVLPVMDLVGWICHLAGADSRTYIPILGWTTVALLGIFLLRGSYNAWSPVVRKYEVTVAKKPEPGAPRKYTIAVASDIHLGNIVGNRYLAKLTGLLNGLKPDLTLLVGDVLDDSIEPFLRNKMSDEMKKLSAKYGVFAVLGNHEYYGGHVERYVKEMSEIGIPVLRDEVVSVAGGAIYIAGRKDLTAVRMDPEGRLSVSDLLTQLDHTKPIVLLDHQPYAFDKAQEAGADLLLCGHTHRGQFAPNHFITKRLFELDWGYMLKEKMHVIVSSGFGSWGPPIRLASRSEVIHIELTLTEE